MKQWRSIAGKIPLWQLDLLDFAVRAIAAILNLTRTRFASRMHVSVGGCQREVEDGYAWDKDPYEDEGGVPRGSVTSATSAR